MQVWSKLEIEALPILNANFKMGLVMPIQAANLYFSTLPES